MKCYGLMLVGFTAQYQMIGYSKQNLNYLKVEQPDPEVDPSDKQDQFIHFKV